MDAILGSWGLGAIAASMGKKHYVDRFAFDALMSMCIPPMSSHHAGLLDLFPFLIFDHIYIDKQSYRGLVDLNTSVFQLSNLGKEILREFTRQNILVKIDYADLIEGYSDEIIEYSEIQLASSDLRKQLKDSRVLWVKFLESEGGHLHAFRNQELTSTYAAIGQSEFLESQDAVAQKIAHDVYDVNAMLVLSKRLNLPICDWQMYSPLYEHQMLRSYPWMKKLSANSTSTIRDSLDVYLPIPRTPSIETIFKFREEKTVIAFQNYTQFLEKPVESYSPFEYLELREKLLQIGASDDIARVGVFPRSEVPPAFSEDIIRTIVRQEIENKFMNESRSASRGIIQVFQKITNQNIHIGDVNNIGDVTAKDGVVQIGNSSNQTANLQRPTTGEDMSEIVKLIGQLVDLVNKENLAVQDKSKLLESAKNAKEEAAKNKGNIEVLAQHLKNIASIAGSATAIGKLVETIISMLR